MKTQNKKVDIFLEEIREVDENKYQILLKLREIVFEINPKIEEKIMYGGIMFSLEDSFGGIFPSQKHVSFEFSEGYKMEDPNSQLEGTGKFRRHLKIKTIEEIETKDVVFFVKQSIKK